MSLVTAASLVKIPTTSLRRLISWFSRSIGLVECILAGVGRETHVGQHVGFSLVHQRGQFGHTGPRLIGDITPLLASGGRIVLSERGADPGRDDAALGLARVGHGITHEMDPGAVELFGLWCGPGSQAP